ncbi:MAG: helix-turn-helix domain-containing protein [Dehalococcoidia bacterium]
MDRNGFQAALAKKLRKQTSLLTDEEVAFVTRRTLKMLRESFGDNPYFDAQSMGRIIRWSSLRARCEREREKRNLSLKDASVRLKIPQYRLRAIESGELAAFEPEMAREYFQFLGIDRWIDRWRRANRDLADLAWFDSSSKERRKRRSSQG